MIRTLSRAAVGGTISAAAWPLRRVAGLFPAGGLLVDQADAALRDVAGTILFDEQLHEDARRRREAVAERLTAVNLRMEAEETRAAAREDAERKRRQARSQAQAEKERVEQSAQRRKQSARADARETAEELEERARGERLDVLEKQSEALEEERAAVTVGAEAQRLGDAAARAKAARKSD